MRSRIQQLSQHLVNKIAAGEVIERPANVVKELLENAVDAGSTRIDLEIASGGLELVRVTDNGHGIPEAELPLALASHATSKLQSEDDLFRVRTLGFRGEALASLAAVSRLTLTSRTADQTSGMQIQVMGGSAGAIHPVGVPVGTTLEVADLFFNTPVRKKFLRSPQTEASHVVEAFQRVALAYPAIHFTLKQNGRVTFDIPPADPWLERIAKFFGPEVSESLIDVASEESGVSLAGYVANPTQSRANNKAQFLFLNGRFIRDRSLQHALSEAYRGLLLVGRFPICFLRLDMPPDLVDVNVHPTKLEVRFQDGGRHYAQLLSTLRNRFLGSDLMARWKSQTGPANVATPLHAEPVAREAELPLHPAHTARHVQSVLNWANAPRSLLPAGPSDDELIPTTSRVAAAIEWQMPPAQRGLSLNPVEPVSAVASPAAPAVLAPTGRGGEGGLPALDREAIAPSGMEDLVGIAPTLDAAHDPSPPLMHAPLRSAADWDAAQLLTAARSQTAMQVLNRYLVAESPEGVVIIDQHALHERILYEEIRNKVLSKQLQIQRLLVPEPVEFTPREAALLQESAELLQTLGIETEAFGGTTILVRGYPAILRRLNAEALLRELVNHLSKPGKVPEPRDLLDHMLHSMACQAAVKAGDPLSAAEIHALLQQRDFAQDHHHCPHGRPTTIVFTREELDRQFRRT